MYSGAKLLKILHTRKLSADYLRTHCIFMFRRVRQLCSFYTHLIISPYNHTLSLSPLTNKRDILAIWYYRFHWMLVFLLLFFSSNFLLPKWIVSELGAFMFEFAKKRPQFFNHQYFQFLRKTQRQLEQKNQVAN